MANEFAEGIFAVDSKRLKRYIKRRKIGSSVYGVVYEGKDSETGEIVAWKQMILEDFVFSLTEDISLAVNLFKSFDHPSLVKIIDVMYTNLNTMHLVMEYLEMDLKRYLGSNVTEIKEELIRSYMKQILEGLVYLYSHDVLHRAIRPANILMDNIGHVKLTDFAVRAYVNLNTCPHLHEIVRLRYAGPELLLGGFDYGGAADMWSLGCVFAEMFTRKILFRGDSQIDQLFRIFKVFGTPSETVWPGVTTLPYYNSKMPYWKAKKFKEIVSVPNKDAEEILQSLLALAPQRRPSPKVLLALDYIKDAKLVSPGFEELV